MTGTTTLVHVATALAGLVALGVVALGVHGWSAPRTAAGFGIPGTTTDDPAVRAWLRVKAVRDVGSGLLLLVVLAAGSPGLLGACLLVAAAIPAGDAVVVVHSGGPRRTAWGVHGSTAAVMAAAAVPLLAA